MKIKLMTIPLLLIKALGYCQPSFLRIEETFSNDGTITIHEASLVSKFETTLLNKCSIKALEKVMNPIVWKFCLPFNNNPLNILNYETKFCNTTFQV